MLPEVISNGIPELKQEVGKAFYKQNAAAVLQVVVNFARDMLVKRNLCRVKWCIYYVGSVHEKGDAVVKDIIENLFVRSFNGMKRLCGPVEWQEVYSKIPVNLGTIYLRQANALQ